MITVLISHDSRDEKAASEIKQFLEAAFPSVEAYVATRDLVGGQTWVEAIKSRLKEARVIISLLTSKSLQNSWVLFESGAGFVEDKTIPLLSDNLQMHDLRPPLSLLQARMVTKDGIESLIKDVSNKLNQRVPVNYPSINELISKIEKIARKDSVLHLKNLLPWNKVAPNAEPPWIYEENCLVYDYTLASGQKFAVDTYFYIDRTEIQLFGRRGFEDFVLKEMSKINGFLPCPADEYERSGNRLIFQRFKSNEEIEAVAKALSELLSRIESYIKQTSTG